MTTDKQACAALAAAAQIVANNGYAPSPLIAQQITLNMANAFLTWLQRPGRITVERHADERLVPNEDFRSPSQARTERIDPSAVLAAAAEPTMPRRTVGPHTLSPTRITPSGARACECGEKWPCSRARLDRAP